MFICRHCPYVQHIKAELSRLGKDYAKKDIGIVAISSNDAGNYPDDAPESLKEFAKEENFSFPFGYDESQAVAKAYTAACTPDFFLLNKARKLVYRGQLDSSRPGRGPDRPGGGVLNGADVPAAIAPALADRPVNPQQTPRIGSNINGN